MQSLKQWLTSLEKQGMPIPMFLKTSTTADTAKVPFALRMGRVDFYNADRVALDGHTKPISKIIPVNELDIQI